MNNYEICNGCGACLLSCPKNAITMQNDSHGFDYPQIDRMQCIHCGICDIVCQNNIINNGVSGCYIVQHRDKDARKNAQSGGLFTALAGMVLSVRGGSVWRCIE